MHATGCDGIKNDQFQEAVVVAPPADQPSPPSPAQAASPAPRRLRHPTWLDLRLVSGVLLVLTSVALGAKVVSSSDQSVHVWALDRDVAAGTTLRTTDLRPARVRLFGTAEEYLRVAESPAGRTVRRSLSAGELLPLSALESGAPGAIISIPLRPENAPGLDRGRAVDVWASTKGCPPVRVLAAVPVHDVRSGAGALSAASGITQVIVRVPPDDAERLVAALSADSTIRIVVLDDPDGTGAGAAATSPVEDCTRSDEGRQRDGLRPAVGPRRVGVRPAEAGGERPDPAPGGS
jgi:hypothetical protein